MAKGRYIKAAERACSRKARFETAAAAEAFAEYRFKAYVCPVCHNWHLTSKGTPTTQPDPPKPEPPVAKLRDLDWSALTKPKAQSLRCDEASPGKNSSTVTQPTTGVHIDNGQAKSKVYAVCAKNRGKDGRVLIVLDNRLVKSAKVEPVLRKQITKGSTVEIEPDTNPPIIRRVRVDA